MLPLKKRYLIAYQVLDILLLLQICGQVQRQVLICHTVHFIDSQWSLQSWCLQTLFVPQDHDADNLADVMAETLANWSLNPDDQVCLTTDNRSNIVCATFKSSWMESFKLLWS